MGVMSYLTCELQLPAFLSAPIQMPTTPRLLTSDAGHEIYLRPASAFGLPPAGRDPKPLTWAQVRCCQLKQLPVSMHLQPHCLSKQV